MFAAGQRECGAYMYIDYSKSNIDVHLTGSFTVAVQWLESEIKP